MNSGTPILGLSSRADVTYPWQLPTVIAETFVYIGAADFSATNHGARWKISGTNAATATVTQPTTLANLDGVRRFSTAGASGDEAYITNGTNSGAFSWTHSTTDPRAVVFMCRTSITSVVANQSGAWGLCVGTGSTGTTDPLGTQCVGAYFVEVAGVLSFCYQTSAITQTVEACIFEDTATAVPTLVLSAMHTYRIEYDGKGKLQAFVDGRRVKNVSLAAFSATHLSPFFGCTANTAAAASIDMDDLFCSVEPSITPKV